MEREILKLEGIEFRRSDTVILRDIHWRILSGQHWALLGANGSGKTSLLRIITGYEWAGKGRVSVLGEQFGECLIHELQKRIGWVSSALACQLPGRDTARKVVLSGLEASVGLYREFDDADFARAAEALSRMGAAHLADKPYEILSQGEQQRVLIARSLVNNPPLLILDEPCAGLDPAAREAFLHDLSLLTQAADAPTLILVTHHIEEIRGWITHVLLLREGRVLARGPREDLLTDDTVGAAFDIACRVTLSEGTYRLDISGAEGGTSSKP